MKTLFKNLFLLALLLFLSVPISKSPAQEFVPAGQLPLPRAFHGAATVGQYYYAVGGSTFIESQNKEPVPNSVHKALIDPDGILGPWTPAQSLPDARYYISNATITLGDTIYIVGGADGPDGDSLDTVLWARSDSRGNLTPWRTSAPFGQKLANVTAVSTPGYLHVIGGATFIGEKGQVSNRVISNRVRPDGSLGEWIEGPSLPYSVWYHQAQVAQNRVYVWGGITNPDYRLPVMSPYVISAPILANGLLGDWEKEAYELPQAFYGGASAVAGPYLLTFSPRYGDQALSNDVWWTFIGSDGMQSWQRRPTQLPMRLYHGVAADYLNGAIYVSGGRFDRPGNKLNTVAMFRLSDKARQAALAGYQSARAAHSESLTSYSPSEPADIHMPRGFQSLEFARRLSGNSGGKPLVLFFTVNTSDPCREQRQLIDSPDFEPLLKQAIFTQVNASDNAQLNQQIGVFRVPAWVFYDGNGEIQRKETGVLSAPEIAQMIQEIRGG